MEKFTGLTKIEVEQRKAAGQGSQAPPQITKSTASIIKGNICTLFNFLNFVIAILLFIAGAYSNMLFIAIIILNIVIGIFQELKAKKLVDELSILNRPSVHVIREGKEEKQIHSELLDSMKKVTHFTSFLIIPLGVLLFLEAAVLRNLTFSNSIVSSAAALLGMLPKGLVLLISVSWQLALSALPK
ncbi:MAG: hypothetical protein ACLVI9_06835 [Anaerostipes hadrus]